MARRQSTEEKVAEKMANLTNDLTLDLEQVGIYLGRDSAISYNRFQIIAESAKHEKQGDKNDYNY